jgi:polyphosphate kinase
MQRNLDYRIEVTCPIYDKKIKEELWTMLQIQMNDNCKARIISRDNPNQYRKTTSETPVRSQVEIYKYFKNKYEENS